MAAVVGEILAAVEYPHGIHHVTVALVKAESTQGRYPHTHTRTYMYGYLPWFLSAHRVDFLVSNTSECIQHSWGKRRKLNELGSRVSRLLPFMSRV